MKKIACMLLCLVMLLSMAACGGEKTEGTSDSVQRNDGAYEPGEELTAASSPSKDAADNEYTLSEYLTAGETIWYQFSENRGKDSYVRKIYVFEPDGSMYFMDSPQMTLGELEKMEDAEIVEMVKAAYIAYASRAVCTPDDVNTMIFSSDPFYSSTDFTRDELKDDLEKRLAYENVYGEVLKSILEEEMDSIYNLYQRCQDIFKSVVDKSKDHPWLDYACQFAAEWLSSVRGEYGDCSVYWSDMVSEDLLTEAQVLESQRIYEDILAITAQIADKLDAVLEENQEPGQYQLVINSDSTGNNTASMTLVYMYENMFGVNFGRIELSYQYPAGHNSGNATTVVYDSVYGGYHYSGDGYFYTRASENAHFMLDTLGTYDIPVDPSLDLEDYWSMFDIKISYLDYIARL